VELRRRLQQAMQVHRPIYCSPQLVLSPDTASAPDRPRVTVIVCTKNRPEFLGSCLQGIDRTLAAGDQLLVMEDGDSHGPDAVAGLASEYRLVHEDGHWKTWMLNRAAVLSANEVLLMTDDDCEVPTGWIEGMARAFGDESVGIAFGPMEGLAGLPGGVPPRLLPGPAPFAPWWYSHGASMAVRRSALLEVGGFDERLGPGRPPGCGEEPDLILRLQRRGWICVIADAPSVRHLEWRDKAENVQTLLRYERGSGAWLGAALRREGGRVLGLLKLRLHYQLGAFDRAELRGRWFGLRALLAFLSGLGRGLTFAEKRFIAPTSEIAAPW